MDKEKIFVLVSLFSCYLIGKFYVDLSFFGELFEK